MNKDGWRKVKLGDIIIKMKKADHGAKDGLDSGKYPFFTNSTTDKKLYFNEYDYDEPIILANTGGAAYFKYCDEKCSGSRDLFVFKCIDNVDTKFLYYVLHDNTEKINEEMFKGVAIKHLQKNDFLSMEIDLPPYSEQLQIAESLSHLDSLISVKGGEVSLMTNMKQQLMNDIFNTSTDGLQRETWRKVKLGDICSLDTGEFIRKDKQVDSGEYPVYNGGVTNTGMHNEYNREGPAIIISARGSAGYVNMVEGKYWAGNSLYSIKPLRDDVDFKYLYYVVKSNQEKLQGMAQSSTLPAVNKGQVAELEIILPPISIQHKISSILSAYDSLISSTDDKSLNLRLAKQQLMNNIFSERESNKNLVFTDTWRKVKLGDLFDVRNGYTPSKSNDAFWANGDIPWFRMEDIRLNGNILTDAVQHITSLGVKSSGLFPADSIIEATTATIGEHALIKVPFICNQRFTCFTVKDSYKDSTDINYLHYIFYQVDEFCKNHLNDGALPAVDKTALLEYEVYLPSLPEQKQISSILSDYDCLIESERERVKAFLEKQRHSSCRRYLIKYETKKLVEICKHEHSNKYQVHSADYDDSFKTPVLTAGKTFILGYTDETDGIYEATPSNPVIIFDDFTTASRLVEFNFKVKSGAMKFIKACEDVDIRYLYYIMSTLEYTPAEHARQWIQNYSQLEVQIPSLEHQHIIASLLESYDDLISTTQSEREHLLKIKQQLMTEIFGG